MSSVRRRHFGSVRKLPSGRFQASYWHEGTRHRAPSTFATKADALAWLSATETDIGRGAWTDPRHGDLTLAEVARLWLHANPAKRPNTLAMDDIVVGVHLKPVGNRRIASITPPDVQTLVNTWSRVAAPRTVKRRYGVLAAIFNHAVEADWLARSPCRAIKLPSVGPTRRRLLSPADIAALAEATDERFRAMVWLGAVLGWRWEEVAGLRVGAVDLLRGTITVTETNIRDGSGRPVRGEPKSEASRRTVAHSTDLGEVLASHMAARGLTGADTDRLLFEAPMGGPLRYSNWRNRVWLPAAREAGLAGAGFHDLRRASATALVAGGVDVKTAQVRLGHSDPRLTLGIYAQATSAGDKAAAELLGTQFLGLFGFQGGAASPWVTQS
jgi:integrase